MRPAKTQGDPEALGATHSNIGTPVPRRLEQGQTEQIRRHNNQSLDLMGLFHHRCIVLNRSGAGGIAQQDPESAVIQLARVGIPEHHLDP